MRAFIFPGQGSQKVGMGADLADASAAARETFQEVDDALNQKLSAMMREGPDSELTLTSNAQPAIMASAIATLLVLAQFSEGFVGSGVWTKSLDISKRYSTLAHGFMNGLGCAARPNPAELSPSRHSDADLLHVMSVFSTRSHPPVSPPAYHEGLRRTGMLLSMHCLAR